MGDNTNIEWTDATWNPIVGCSIVSPGCTNCYAMRFAGNRLDGNPKSPHYVGTTQKSKAGPVWSGKLALAPTHVLNAPLKWSRPRRIFVNSMGDLFHEDCPDEWIDQVFAVMALASRHTFQVLTKRAERMRAWVSRLGEAHVKTHRFFQGHSVISPAHDALDAFPHYIRALTHPSQHGLWPLPNVWFGVSAEDQRRYDERRADLRGTPAAVRFLSIEPMLGPSPLI
jgi:protein gp37